MAHSERYRSGHNEAVLKTVWGKPHKGSNPFLSAKKEVTFVYQKLLLFLSKPQAWYIIRRKSVYHQRRVAPLYLITHQRVFYLRLDDIPQQVADDIQGSRLDLFAKI